MEIGTVVVVASPESSFEGRCGQVVEKAGDTVVVRLITIPETLSFSEFELLSLVDMAPGELTEMFGS